MATSPERDACSAGCMIITVAFLAIALAGQSVSPDAAGGILLGAVVLAIGAYVLVKRLWYRNHEMELTYMKKMASDSLASRTTVTSGAKAAEVSVEFICSATYFGGHKQFGNRSEVTIAFANDRLLIKEFPGLPPLRIDIPYACIQDFGVATHEQLTVSRFLLVGIMALAMKKKTNYLYVKFRDEMGFEHNPVVGETVNCTVEDVSAHLYTLIKKQREV